MYILRWQKHIYKPVIFLSIILLLVHGQVLHASSPSKKLSEIQRKLKEKKRKIKEAEKQEKSILSRIQDLEKKIHTTEKEIKKYETLISRTRREIKGITTEISNTEIKIKKLQKYLGQRLRALYEQQYGGYFILLFTAKDYQDLIRRSRYISLLSYHDVKTINKYRETLRDLNFKKNTLVTLQNRLETAKEEARKRYKILKTDRIRKDKLLAMIRSKKSTYKQAVKELEKSQKRLKEMIKKMRERRLPKSVIGKGFRAMKGKLPWPLNGRVVVPFGRYTDPKFKITVFKNGIEIKGKLGAKPRAVAGGRVVYADWFKGYGMLLIISHGSGYHTLYGNLSEIFHSVGDIINKGEVVGRIGRSSFTNLPTLYFEIRYKGKPLDPMKWLKRRTRAKKRLR